MASREKMNSITHTGHRYQLEIQICFPSTVLLRRNKRLIVETQVLYVETLLTECLLLWIQANIAHNLGIFIPILKIKKMKLSSQLMRVHMSSLWFGQNFRSNRSIIILHNSLHCICDYLQQIIYYSPSRVFFYSLSLHFFVCLKSPQVKVLSGIVVLYPDYYNHDCDMHF